VFLLESQALKARAAPNGITLVPTTMRGTEMTEDRDVLIAAEVIEDLLCLVPPEKRLEVIKQVAAKEELAAKKREERGDRLELMFFDEASMERWEASPANRYWNHIMRFKSLVIQIFTRDITNDHSKEKAAQILFMEHKNGHGSGWLPDYLDGLPALKVDLKKAAALAQDHRPNQK
jgi:hypothetical protein